jgi:hypothetical protein
MVENTRNVPLNRRVNMLHHFTTLILLRIFIKADHAILLVYCCMYLTIFNLN